MLVYTTQTWQTSHTIILLVAIALIILIPLKTTLINQPKSPHCIWLKHEIFKISMTEVILGCLAGISILVLSSIDDWTRPPLRVNYSIFVMIVVAYHKGESIFVLVYHIQEYSWNSYVIYHQGATGYIYMIFVINVEFVIEAALMYKFKIYANFVFVVVFGGVAAAGLALRNLAFHQAKWNFSHFIRYHIDEKHRLIKTGMYALDRHPSYVGYLTAVIGLIILLKNPISLLVYPRLMIRYYRYRIYDEECSLLMIFKDDYRRYMMTTGNMIGYPRASE